MKKEHLAMIASYARTAFSAGLAVALSGNLEARSIVIAMLASVSAPLMRWLNPNDPAFGRGSAK